MAQCGQLIPPTSVRAAESTFDLKKKRMSRTYGRSGGETGDVAIRKSCLASHLMHLQFAHTF